MGLGLILHPLCVLFYGFKTKKGKGNTIYIFFYSSINSIDSSKCPAVETSR
jgi:hypothetical protein